MLPETGVGPPAPVQRSGLKSVKGGATISDSTGAPAGEAGGVAGEGSLESWRTTPSISSNT